MLPVLKLTMLGPSGALSLNDHQTETLPNSAQFRFGRNGIQLPLYIPNTSNLAWIHPKRGYNGGKSKEFFQAITRDSYKKKYVVELGRREKN